MTMMLTGRRGLACMYYDMPVPSESSSVTFISAFWASDLHQNVYVHRNDEVSGKSYLWILVFNESTSMGLPELIPLCEGRS